jgi:hypothetical protein
MVSGEEDEWSGTVVRYESFDTNLYLLVDVQEK